MSIDPRLASVAFALAPLALGCSEAGSPAGDTENSVTVPQSESATSDDLPSSSGDGDDADSSSGSSSSSSSGTGELPELPIPQGEEVWRRVLMQGHAMSVAGTADGGAIVVGTDDRERGRGFAVRVDAEGDTLWSRTLAPQGEHASYQDVAIAADGSIWIAGFRSWDNALFARRSMVLERLDDATGEVLWEDPGLEIDGSFGSSNELHAVLAIEGGVLVGGGELSATETIGRKPMVRRYEDDGTVAWSGGIQETGRTTDLALLDDDTLLVVGAHFESSNDGEPLEPWALVMNLDGEGIAAPRMPPGRADFTIAVASPDLGGFALGERYQEEPFRDEDGWMQPIAADGSLGAPVELPDYLAGAAITDDGALVVSHRTNVDAYDLEGTLLWTVEDTVTTVNTPHALALAADGTVFTAGGIDAVELAKVAAPMR